MFREVFPALLLIFGIAAVIFKILPLGIPFSPDFYFYRTSPWANVNPAYLFYGIATAIAAILLPRFHGRIKTYLLVMAVMTLCLILNMNICRPMAYSWSFRILYTTDTNLNPFFAKGLSINKISEYPLTHLRKASHGFMGSEKEENRLTTHPPGLPVSYALLNKTLNASPSLKNLFRNFALHEKILTEKEHSEFYAPAAVSILLCFIALALIPLLVFLIIREMSSEKNALMGAIFSILVPSFQIFAPTPNIYFPPLALLIVYCCLKGLRLRRSATLHVSSGEGFASSNPAYISSGEGFASSNPAHNMKSNLFFLLCGILTGLSLFLTFEFLPVLLFCFIFILFQYSENKDWLTVRKNILFWACGGLAVYLVYLLCGYDPVKMFFIVMKNNQEFYAWFKRSYVVSVPFNIIEFCAFSGIACFSIFFVDFFAGIEKITEWRGLPSAFAGTLGIVFLLFIFSGSVRGELARNCMSFMPLFVITAFAKELFSEKLFYICGILCIIYLIFISSFIEVFYWFNV